MLKLQNADIGYLSKQKLIENADFELLPGETAALIGINGAGKSTLLRTLGGTISTLTGKIFLDEIHISKLNEIEIAKKIAFVSTEIIKIRHITAYELTALGRFPHTDVFGRLSSADSAAVEKAMQKVGIEHLRNKFIDQMSDGERQRLMIARALAQETDILLLDEPASFLDLENKYLVYEILKTAAEQEKKAVLYSTHDLNLALKTADKLLIIKDKKLLIGAPEDLINQGVFDSIFSTQKLVFDHETLDFRIKAHGNREICISGSNQKINALISNALTRKNFVPVSHKTDFEITFKEEEDSLILYLNLMNEIKEFENFYNLITFLDKIIN